MTTRPINLTDWQIRAALDGRLSLVVEPLAKQPHNRAQGCYHRPDGSWVWVDAHRVNNGVGYFGNRLDDRHFYTNRATGDRLWVREAWRTWESVDGISPRDLTRLETVQFQADGMTDNRMIMSRPGKVRSSPQMPRWASRLTLIVTNVRVMRVQSVRSQQVKAAGVHPDDDMVRASYLKQNQRARVDGYHKAHTTPFLDFWNARHAKRGLGWDANPWVTATTFTVHRKNIDQMEADHG